MTATTNPIQEVGVQVESGADRSARRAAECPREELLQRGLRIRAQAIWGSNEVEDRPARIPEATRHTRD
jgi:hypothetical protein